MKYILAHDFGTSADKAALFSEDGSLIDSRTASYPSYYMSGGVEQDAHDWWRIFCENTKALLAKRDPGDVICVTFDGTAPNCLCLDSNMQPLAKAMIWQDVRATEEAEWLSSRLPEPYLKGHPGGRLSADRMLCKLLWLKKNRPELYARTVKVLPSVNSYIILRLTGQLVCDYGVGRTTAMLEPDQSDWADEVLALAEIDRSLLPKLSDRTAVAGYVSERISEACGLAAGTAVIAGTVDYACTAIGGGVYGASRFLLSGGTSASIEGYLQDGTRFGRATTASGGSLNWLKNQVCHMEQLLAKETGQDVYELINQAVAKAPVGSGGVIFQPYLSGARSVWNDPEIKGSFTGITLATTREELFRSVIEGIGFNLALILREIRNTGTQVTRMPIVGGLGKGAVVRQIFADIMDVELVTYESVGQEAAAGAAILGGIGIGLFADVSAAEQFLHIKEITRPIPENRDAYAAILPRFEKVYHQLAAYYHESENRSLTE